jgi:hypothetical protein
MYLRRKLNREGGFTIAEILVAGFILAFALIPIVRMFDYSFSGIRQLEAIQDSVNCARAAVEEIRSMPFYEPYNATFGNVDIDDRFWGSRTPETTNPGGSIPDWETIPEAEYYAYGAFTDYEAYRIGVKLAYLDDDTGVAIILDGWGPKTPGKDRPKDSANESLHLLLVQVNAYWMKDGNESKYTLESVVTDTEAIYNLGISSVTVTGPAAIQDLDEDGMVSKANAAAHWSSPNVDAQVEIKGWGFNPDLAANLTASIVRDKNNDIPITLSYTSPDTLRGTLKLYNTGTDIAGEADWYPRAAVGSWSVKVKQETILSTYLYQGFIVQYPKPVISDFGNAADMSKSGENYLSAASLKVVGGPFINQVKTPAVRLIQYGDNDEILNQVNGTNITLTVPASTYGYALSPNCTITANFDLTTAAPGEYHMVVVNTDEPTLIGHVASNRSAAVYTIIDTIPIVDNAYVYGTDPHDSRAYNNVGNPWRLVIEGSYFSMVGSPSVDVYICSAVAGDLPSGNFVQGTNPSVTNYNTIVAYFDFSTLPVGNYLVFVRNRVNGKVGWSAAPVFTLLAFGGNVGGFTASSGNFYENYYDIASKITGNGFADASRVTITNGTVEYDITSECTLGGSNEIPVNLNLINCAYSGSWKVRIYFLSNFYLEQAFTISRGPAKILAANDDPNRPAISIWREGRSRTASTSNETSTQKAEAWETTGSFSNRAYATFTVLGMGFSVSSSSTTTLRIYRGTTTVQSNNYTTTIMDRDAKKVGIVSGRWQMENTTVPVDCGISVKRNDGDTTLDAYGTRWRLID